MVGGAPPPQKQMAMMKNMENMTLEEIEQRIQEINAKMFTGVPHGAMQAPQSPLKAIDDGAS